MLWYSCWLVIWNIISKNVNINRSDINCPWWFNIELNFIPSSLSGFILTNPRQSLSSITSVTFISYWIMKSISYRFPTLTFSLLLPDKSTLYWEKISSSSATNSINSSTRYRAVVLYVIASSDFKSLSIKGLSLQYAMLPKFNVTIKRKRKVLLTH